MASLLFVSYTAEMTGPSNSLMLLLQGLRPSFHVSVVVPGDGPLATRLRDMGVQVHDVGPLTKRNLLSLMGLDPEHLTFFYGGLDHKLVGVEGAEPIQEVIA
jgi:hypothetical protein